MIFKAWVFILLFVVTELFLYTILMDMLKTIRHCATAKAYSKACLAGATISYKDFENSVKNKENKEEEKNGSK